MAIITLKDALDYTGAAAAEQDKLQIMVDAADAAIKFQVGMDVEQTKYPAAVVGGEGDSGYYQGDGSRHLFLRQGPVNTIAVTGDTVSGSTTVSSVSAVTYLFAGQSIVGTGIPAEATISSVGATSIVLSVAATATGTAVTLTAGIAVWFDPTGYFGVNPDGSFAADTLLVDGEEYALQTDGCLPDGSVKCSYKGVVERLSGVWSGARVRERGTLIAGHGLAQGNIKVAYVAGYPTVPADLKAAALQLVSWMRHTAAYGGAFLKGEKLGAYEYSLEMMKASTVQIGSVRSILGRYKRRRVA